MRFRRLFENSSFFEVQHVKLINDNDIEENLLEIVINCFSNISKVSVYKSILFQT